MHNAVYRALAGQGGDQRGPRDVPGTSLLHHHIQGGLPVVIPMVQHLTQAEILVHRKFGEVDVRRLFLCLGDVPVLIQKLIPDIGILLLQRRQRSRRRLGPVDRLGQGHGPGQGRSAGDGHRELPGALSVVACAVIDVALDGGAVRNRNIVSAHLAGACLARTGRLSGSIGSLRLRPRGQAGGLHEAVVEVRHPPVRVGVAADRAVIVVDHLIQDAGIRNRPCPLAGEGEIHPGGLGQEHGAGRVDLRAVRRDDGAVSVGHPAEHRVDDRGLAASRISRLQHRAVPGDDIHRAGGGAVVPELCAGEDAGVGASVKGHAVEILRRVPDIIGAVAGAIRPVIAKQTAPVVHAALALGQNAQSRIEHIDAPGGAVVHGQHRPAAGGKLGILHHQGRRIAQHIDRPSAALNAQHPRRRDHAILIGAVAVAGIGVFKRIVSVCDQPGAGDIGGRAVFHDQAVAHKAVGLHIQIVKRDDRAVGRHDRRADAGEVIGVFPGGLVRQPDGARDIQRRAVRVYRGKTFALHRRVQRKRCAAGLGPVRFLPAELPVLEGVSDIDMPRVVPVLPHGIRFPIGHRSV